MKFVRTPFLQNITGRLLLIIVVSKVVKGELVNETVNYDTEIKAHVPIWARRVSYQKEQSMWMSRFNLCFQRRSPEQKPLWLSNEYQIQLKEGICWRNISTPVTNLPKEGNTYFKLLNLLVPIFCYYEMVFDNLVHAWHQVRKNFFIVEIVVRSVNLIIEI